MRAAAPWLLVLGACTSPSSDAAGAAAADGVLFLAQAVPPQVVMDALFQGRVVIDSAGCMRLDSADPATVVWPYGSRLERRRRDQLVLDADGRTIGVVGGSFRFGGGEVTTLNGGLSLAGGARTAALARCPGRFWIVGDVYSAEGAREP